MSRPNARAAARTVWPGATEMADPSIVIEKELIAARNPKAETRRPKEIRNPKAESRTKTPEGQLDVGSKAEGTWLIFSKWRRR